MKVSKRQFAKKEVHYLDHVVRVVNPDPERIQCVLQCPRSQTKRDVKAFLGLAGYYRRFVPGYATMATPPSDLTRKGKPEQVLCTAECEATFKALKRVLVSALVLQIVEPSKPYTLQTDASG